MPTQNITYSVADIVSQLLVDLGLATLDGAWPAFYSMEPDAPDNCITVFDTVGKSQGRNMRDGQLFGFYGFQVRIRAVTHRVGWTKADAIQAALCGQVDQNVVHVESKSYLVWSCDNVSDIIALGRDAPTSQRRLFTINGLAYIEEL